MKLRSLALVAALAGLALSGCLNLAPKPDPTRFFTLSPGEVAEVVPTTTTQVRVVEVAPHLQTRHLVLREGRHEVRYAPFWLWAGPLDRLVEARLKHALDEAEVVLPEGTFVEVRLARLEGLVCGEATLVADWSLWTNGLSREYVRCRFSASLPWDDTTDVEALVGSLSALSGALSSEVAAALEPLETNSLVE